ncbi:MAG TPA: hypothetical protein VGN69_01795 [Solirubrobacteraceae bacterium]|jgi:hypothetical protein|nr:hypothetical protein [Solirubrobacteraceae bacterium]
MTTEDTQSGAGGAADNSPEAHDEISPHDLPPDHPARPEVIEQAGGMDGTAAGPHSEPNLPEGEQDPNLTGG